MVASSGTGATTATLLHRGDRDRHVEMLMDAARLGHGWHTKVRVVRPSTDEVLWMEERTAAILDPETGKLRVYGFTWNITAQQQQNQPDPSSSDPGLHAKSDTAEFRSRIAVWRAAQRECREAERTYFLALRDRRLSGRLDARVTDLRSNATLELDHLLAAAQDAAWLSRT